MTETIVNAQSLYTILTQFLLMSYNIIIILIMVCVTKLYGSLPVDRQDRWKGREHHIVQD